MAKYIVETYYTCTFKVKHYLEDISNNQLEQLEKREDGEYEILDVKFDKRNTKNLEKSNGNVEVKYNESSNSLKNTNTIFSIIYINSGFRTNSYPLFDFIDYASLK